jgi:dihydroorotase
MTNHITLPLFDDFHVHLREGEMAKEILRQTINGGAGRLMAMPNTKNPLTDTGKILEYKNFIESQKAGLNLELEIMYSLYLSNGLSCEEIHKAKLNGINNVKMYPAGVTTNSSFGVSNIEVFYPIFEAMQDLDMIFNIHGEVPSDFGRNICVLNAEAKFLPVMDKLIKDFPKLRIVLEHMTSYEAVEYVKNSTSANLAATITAHHLDLTVDDWAGKNHNFCKPVAKYPADCQALRDIVASGNPKFFLGSDSAPHSKETKETACGCAGVYTAPFLGCYLADSFEKMSCLDKLANFSSKFGADFYKLPYQTRTLNLVKNPQIITNILHGVVPYRANETVNWTIEL